MQIIYLGASKIHNVGVFSGANIKKGEVVEVWDKKDYKFVKRKEKEYMCKKNPELKFFFNRYCVETNEGWGCPKNFLRISTGWFLNHSKKPNLETKDDGDSFQALKNIKKGEELTLDYKILDEEVDNIKEKLKYK
jgi:SET domain-containing protein